MINFKVRLRNPVFIAQLVLGDNLLHHVKGNFFVHEMVIVPVTKVPTNGLAIVLHELGAVFPVVVQGCRRGHFSHMLFDDL